jgi:transposase InsO family protein
MDNDGQGCQGLCAELFSLYRYNSWKQSATPAGYAATSFDFLYIGLSRDGKYQYLLLLKDDLSGYLWLVPCRTADAAATVDALMRWFAVFGFVLLWISDRGSHFKNEAVQRVQKEIKAKHHFTTANCP